MFIKRKAKILWRVPRLLQIGRKSDFGRIVDCDGSCIWLKNTYSVAGMRAKKIETKMFKKLIL